MRGCLPAMTDHPCQPLGMLATMWPRKPFPTTPGDTQPNTCLEPPLVLRSPRRRRAKRRKAGQSPGQGLKGARIFCHLQPLFWTFTE